MGKPVHRLSNLDTKSKTADCAGCGCRVDVRAKPAGKGKVRWKCREALKKWHHVNRGKEHIARPLVCSLCKFQATHRCQIDIHHRDGDHQNNAPTNRVPVCANCHRLLSWQEKHYLHPADRPKKKGQPKK